GLAAFTAIPNIAQADNSRIYIKNRNPNILNKTPKPPSDDDIIIPNSSICSILTANDFFGNPENQSIEELAESSLNYTRNPPHVDKKDIVIHSKYPIKDLHSINLTDCNLESMDISEKQAKELLLHFASLVSQPKKLLGLLKPIEEALSIELEKRGISFTEDDNPKFLIEGKNIFMIGPPKEEKRLKRKGRIIDEVLLKEEQKIGLNLRGSPIFVGFVDSEKANPFVMGGNTFKEDVSVSRMILHGKNSHRLAILAFANSLKGTEFEGISPRNILQLLIQAKISGHPAWAFLLDTNSNIPRMSAPNSDFFDYNCRSPFVLNSLILCFGDKFGLPNLTHCMRDSFWKSTNKMIEEVQKNLPNTEISKASIYLTIMLELVALGSLSDVGQIFSFTKSDTIAALDPKYIPHPNNIEGIKVKLSKGAIQDPETYKQNLFAMMHRNPEALYEISEDPTYEKLILEFLEDHLPLEEMGSYSFRPGKILEFINKILRKRCKTLDQKITSTLSLLKKNRTTSNHIALQFIAENIEILPTLLDKLSKSQKEELLITAIENDSTTIVTKLIDSKVQVKHKKYQRHPIHAAITANHKETVYAIIKKLPSLLDIKDIDEETVRTRIEKREKDGRWQ
ncbi:MAG: hypothetical protein JSS09_06650, partial [Verrucomicrobia bacterium]|nr:hypothetical protein [Verrucomicrobiota bacterium]